MLIFQRWKHDRDCWFKVDFSTWTIWKPFLTTARYCINNVCYLQTWFPLRSWPSNRCSLLLPSVKYSPKCTLLTFSQMEYERKQQGGLDIRRPVLYLEGQVRLDLDCSLPQQSPPPLVKVSMSMRRYIYFCLNCHEAKKKGCKKWNSISFLLFIGPACIPVVLSSTWSLIGRDKVRTRTRTTSRSQRFLTPCVFSAFEHCVWEWRGKLRCGFPVKETFSILIGHTDWPRCLPADHFWAMTDVTVLKMTTFIFNRAWQEKWKWKQRDSNTALRLKHRSGTHRSPGFSTLSYTGVFHNLEQKCHMNPHDETQANVYATQCAWRYGYKKLPVLFFWFSDAEQTVQIKDRRLLRAADSPAADVFVSFEWHVWILKEIKFCSCFYRNKKRAGRCSDLKWIRPRFSHNMQEKKETTRDWVKRFKA